MFERRLSPLRTYWTEDDEEWEEEGKSFASDNRPLSDVRSRLYNSTNSPANTRAEQLIPVASTTKDLKAWIAQSADATPVYINFVKSVKNKKKKKRAKQQGGEDKENNGTPPRAVMMRGSSGL